jgi:ADP-ribosyl-[dinitrogen reductase] hydrolase
MKINEKLKTSLICGAIGDAIGNRYEGMYKNATVSFDFSWTISDDTQLTLATCEAICTTKIVSAEFIAASFLKWFNAKKLNGLGASTLKALRELQVGGHWALVGRTGEYAAGNGAAMRIAPLAFKEKMNREIINDVCNITHKNTEAYVGALAVYYSIKKAISNEWKGDIDLIKLIVDELPDTQVRDRLLELDSLNHLSIGEVGLKYKPTGYVVDSVPLSIFAAQKINQLSLEELFIELIKVGGDTDTICSMTGQIVGALIHYEQIPKYLLKKFNTLYEAELVNTLVMNWEY